MLARMWRKRRTPPLLVGLQALWKSVWWFLRKLDIVLPEDPAILLQGIFPEVVPTGKKDINNSLKEMQEIYTMEYYSATKNNEFMKFLGKWMDLEGIILSEVT